jgi:hypothetical protein
LDEILNWFEEIICLSVDYNVIKYGLILRRPHENIFAGHKIKYLHLPATE